LREALAICDHPCQRATLYGLKLVGALYLIWLGIQNLPRTAMRHLSRSRPSEQSGLFERGVVVEALNPKTAAFFLAFIPHSWRPAAGYPALQFMALGLISVALNTFATSLWLP